MTQLNYPEPMLSDSLIRLRPWDLGDLECVKQASSDPWIPKGTTVPARYSPEEGAAFIARQHRRITTGQGVSLAIARTTAEDASDEAIGLIILQIRPQVGVAGLGYWVVPAARRHGYASRAVALLSEWGLGAGGFARIEAWVDPDNLRSRRLLERNDFEFEGRLRRFLSVGDRRTDALVYSRIARNLSATCGQTDLEYPMVPGEFGAGGRRDRRITAQPMADHHPDRRRAGESWL
jgi:RimJ/RimL family protein N-acetyltransferase